MQQNEVKMRSVVIPPDTMKELKRWYKSFHTKGLAEKASGLSRQVLDSAILKGTCHEITLEKINQVLEPAKATA